MQKDLRLRKSKEFSRVYRLGTSWVDSVFVLKVLPNGRGDVSRFGFSVGKRLGKAVQRNAIKRRTRESVRQISVKEGWDIAFIARSGSKGATYSQLGSSAKRLLERAGLLSEM
jgi:ribonuclease P protein component